MADPDESEPSDAEAPAAAAPTGRGAPSGGPSDEPLGAADDGADDSDDDEEDMAPARAARGRGGEAGNGEQPHERQEPPGPKRGQSPPAQRAGSVRGRPTRRVAPSRRERASQGLGRRVPTTTVAKNVYGGTGAHVGPRAVVAALDKNRPGSLQLNVTSQWHPTPRHRRVALPAVARFVSRPRRLPPSVPYHVRRLDGVACARFGGGGAPLWLPGWCLPPWLALVVPRRCPRRPVGPCPHAAAPSDGVGGVHVAPPPACGSRRRQR